MTRLLVSTVRRGTPPTVSSGYIYVIDLEAQHVIQRSSIVEPAYKTLDSNPRGGMRGGKGISILSDQIAVANSSMVFHFSPEWDFQGITTHPACSYIHDILFQDETLWVASAGTDMVIQFDRSGKMLRNFYLREPSPALESLQWRPPVLADQDSIRQGRIDFRNPSTHEHVTFDNAHVNSMTFLSNGDLLASMGLIIGLNFAALMRLKIWLMRKGLWSYFLAANRGVKKFLSTKANNTDNTLVVRPAQAKSAIVRISPDGLRTLVLELPNMTTPSHSLVSLPDETMIYLNTTESSVIRFEPYQGRMLSTTRLSEGFLRGATVLSDRLVLLGNKNQILTFDYNRGSVVSSIAFSDDPVESVYDIKVLPPHYSLPPESFSDHIALATGCKSPEEMIQLADRLNQNIT